MQHQPGAKRAATLCIIKSEKGILLLKRAKDPHKGKFIPIGGKIEPFEAPRDAVIREVFEETTLQIREPRLIGIMTETSPTKFNWINYIYVVQGPKRLPIYEIEEGTLEWIDERDLERIPTPTTDRFIYRYIAQNIPFIFDALYDSDVQLIKLTDELNRQVLVG